MDYIDFINSKDIRAYLKSIDYKPNLLESAYFIYASSHKTMDERHMAWEKLMISFWMKRQAADGEKTSDVFLQPME